MNSTGDGKLHKPFVGVVLLAESRREAATLVRVVRNTPLARVVFFSHILPRESLDNRVIEEIQESRARIALVAVETKDPQPAIDVIRLLFMRTTGINVAAYGDAVNSKTVVATMRAGARDFITRGAGPSELTEAFRRLLGNDDSGAAPVPSPPNSSPPGNSSPPEALVGARKPKGPKILPSQKVAVELF